MKKSQIFNSTWTLLQYKLSLSNKNDKEYWVTLYFKPRVTKYTNNQQLRFCILYLLSSNMWMSELNTFWWVFWLCTGLWWWFNHGPSGNCFWGRTLQSVLYAHMCLWRVENGSKYRIQRSCSEVARRKASAKPWLKSSLPEWLKNFINTPDTKLASSSTSAYEPVPQLASLQPQVTMPVCISASYQTTCTPAWFFETLACFPVS